jgi:hypothetical protein
MSVPGNTIAKQIPLILSLCQGDVIRITASGTINTGGWSGSHGPDGNSTITWGGLWPFQGGRAYSLYGIWGKNGFDFPVGSDSGCVDYTTAFGTGSDTIFLGINDENLRDNTGNFNAVIRIYRN